jgi:thiamine biosynthesis protein ThiC
LRFEYLHKPCVRCECDLIYYKQGIITPEMEYIAIRENQKYE